MADAFLDLPRADRAAILAAAAQTLERSALVLEKDVWVCWTLQHLFALHATHPMAFKGGTSLSKVFGVIKRFSEDIDVTLEHSRFAISHDPFDPSLSKTKIKKCTEELREHVATYVRETILTHLKASLGAQFGDGYAVEPDADPEKLRVVYPSALDAGGGYIAESVLLEFGGRNTTLPNNEHVVQPYLAQLKQGFVLPEATVAVLAAERTFWEKATLIHVECNRETAKPNMHRQSRHWYDLVRLGESSIGESALADRALLDDVVRHKRIFYSRGDANYDQCASGGMRLVPAAGPVRDALQKDYAEMIASAMFYEDPPSFEMLLERLGAIEERINGPGNAAPPPAASPPKPT